MLNSWRHFESRNSLKFALSSRSFGIIQPVRATRRFVDAVGVVGYNPNQTSIVSERLVYALFAIQAIKTIRNGSISPCLHRRIPHEFSSNSLKINPFWPLAICGTFH